MSVRLPRGLRNNNPGNIRIGSQVWRGEIRPSQDVSFCQFETIVYGYRAMLKLLRNYRLKYGCRTVEAMIKRWAPPSENATGAYIKFVCKRTGLAASHVVDIDNEREMCKIAEAIACQENGEGFWSYIKMDDIVAGWAIC